MDDPPPTWRPLPLAPLSRELPPLLISTAFSGSSYRIYLTDLVYTWQESLDRKGIIMRAFQEDTTIDPSDGGNMKALLDKLQDAFDPQRKDHHRATLALAPFDGKQTGQDGLLMTVTHVFPPEAGIGPLKWPLYLRRCSLSTTTTELLLPVLHLYHCQSDHANILMSLLREKDNVITRLLDKLDAMGVGLENIFTSLPAKKRISREAAEARIKGLAAFNRLEWESRLITKPEPTPDPHVLVHSVFSGAGTHYQPFPQTNDDPHTSEWWKTIDAVSSLPIRTDSGTKMDLDSPSIPHLGQENDGGGEDDFQVQTTLPRLAQAKGKGNATVSTGDDEDGDFQTQATPPHLKTRATKLPVSMPMDDSTTDEDDDDLDSGTPAPKSAPPAQKPSSRLGTIGGHKKNREPSPPPPAADSHSTETASETGDEAPVQPPLPSESSSAGRRVGGIGRIGGRARATPAADPPARPPSPKVDPGTKTTNSPRTRRIGMIGRKPTGDVSNPPEASGPRGRTHTRDISDEIKRETSQERANRRRAELDRELAAKAAAPTKKKRKF